jgi:hypothetical protein
MDNEDNLIEAVMSAAAEMDALQSLVLAMLDVSKDKDSILAEFVSQTRHGSEMLLNTQISDGYLKLREKAVENLLKIASQKPEPK